MVKNKYIIEKEIELLNESKNTDKFDYQVAVSTYLTLLVLMTSLVVVLSIQRDFTFTITAILWLSLFLGITLHNYFRRFKPIKEEFERKHKMVRKRYKKLGVNIAYLDKEIRK